MNSASVSGNSQAGSRAAVIVLAVIGILALIAGIIFLASSSVPGFMSAGSHLHSGRHLIRAVVSLVIGVALLAGAWFAARKSAASRGA